MEFLVRSLDLGEFTEIEILRSRNNKRSTRSAVSADCTVHGRLRIFGGNCIVTLIGCLSYQAISHCRIVRASTARKSSIDDRIVRNPLSFCCHSRSQVILVLKFLMWVERQDRNPKIC